MSIIKKRQSDIFLAYVNTIFYSTENDLVKFLLTIKFYFLLIIKIEGETQRPCDNHLQV